MKNQNCRNCSAPLEAGSIFCIKCRLASAGSKKPVNNPRYVRNINKGTVITVLAVMFFILAAGILTAALIFGQPIRAMQTSINAINPKSGQENVPSAMQTAQAMHNGATPRASAAIAPEPSVAKVDGNRNCTLTIEKMKDGVNFTPAITGKPEDERMTVALDADGKGPCGVWR